MRDTMGKIYDLRSIPKQTLLGLALNLVSQSRSGEAVTEIVGTEGVHAPRISVYQYRAAVPLKTYCGPNWNE